MQAGAGIRRALIRARNALEDAHNQIRADFAPMESLDLLDFTRDGDVGRFQVTTDRVLGGQTSCSLTLKRYGGFTSALFSGEVDPFGADATAEMRRHGGFASFRTKPGERVRDVAAFRAFELRVKTDGRPYVANFKCEAHGPENLWQSLIVTPRPGAWTTVAIPFRDLRLTRRGRVEALQFDFQAEALSGFGVLLADNVEGPFRFEMQYLRAIRNVDPGLWESAAERRLLEASGRGRALPLAGGGGAPLARNGGGEAPGEGAPPAPAAEEGGAAPTAPSLPAPPHQGASADEWRAWYKAVREKAAVKLK
jgi:NADH dehydrogenase [ubiquinone] 1 alpha subcomplex assembly factor 1